MAYTRAKGRFHELLLQICRWTGYNCRIYSFTNTKSTGNSQRTFWHGFPLTTCLQIWQFWQFGQDVAAFLYLLWDKISSLKVQISAKWAKFIQIKVLCFFGLWKLVKKSAFRFWILTFWSRYGHFWRSLPIYNTFWPSIIPITGTE